MPSRDSHRAGLTRNEVLAVAALVLLVAAVAAPYFQHRAREAARTASLQNLRQWGIALNLHLLENQHILPGSSADPEDPGAWFNTLPPYLSLPPLKDGGPGGGAPAGIWTDPAARLAAGAPPAARVTYAANAWLQPDPAQRPWRIYDIEDPAATFFLVESPPGTLRAAAADQLAFRHGRPPRGHALFCDGHAEAVTPEQARQPLALDPQAHPAPRPRWVPFFGAPAP